MEQSASSRELQFKLAFLFLIQNSLSLAPLWDRFFSGHDAEYSVYVQPTKIEKDELESSLPPSFRSHVLPKRLAQWGTISIVAREKDLLEAALQDPANSHFALVSESCIPLWPFPYIKQYLTAEPVSYIDAAKDPTGAAFGMNNLKWFEGFPKAHPNQMRRGSQWFVLRREHAQLVAEDTHYYNLTQELCKIMWKKNLKKCCSDEFYVQTVVSLGGPSSLSLYPVHHADWRGSYRRYGWAIMHRKPGKAGTGKVAGSLPRENVKRRRRLLALEAGEVEGVGLPLGRVHEGAFAGRDGHVGWDHKGGSDEIENVTSHAVHQLGQTKSPFAGVLARSRHELTGEDRAWSDGDGVDVPAHGSVRFKSRSLLRVSGSISRDGSFDKVRGARMDSSISSSGRSRQRTRAGGSVVLPRGTKMVKRRLRRRGVGSQFVRGKAQLRLVTKSIGGGGLGAAGGKGSGGRSSPESFPTDEPGEEDAAGQAAHGSKLKIADRDVAKEQQNRARMKTHSQGWRVTVNGQTKTIRPDRVVHRWIGAMHPKTYTNATITKGIIKQMKVETNFWKIRPFVSGRLLYTSKIQQLPPEAQTTANGFCSLDGRIRQCFLFARKFKSSTLPFLLQNSKELFGF